MRSFSIILLTVLSLQASSAGAPWGFWGHQRINRMALYTLPEELFAFYKPHADYVEEHAVDPDKRRYAVVEEAPRHYIDIDHYGVHPFEGLPHKWSEAVEKYSEDTLQAYGIVPWHVELMMYRLEDAMREQDAKKIIRLTAEIGHYIADAHVPLHCTENYNGQLTGQNGIHGFWESRIPELLGEDYDYFVGKATYIPFVRDKIWDIVLTSHLMSDTVLHMEAMLDKEFPADRKYTYETRGQSTVRTYSKEYSIAYNASINNMVERRMRETIINLGSFWYTAWINAGKPDLTGLEWTPYTDDELRDMEAMDKAYRSGGGMKGRSEE
ncbi:MAG: S1/P1 Nuclease [Chitinophagales bacterium]|nr:S1/P1 Nuclease [Chitinophagales bacterium]HAE36181.1 S1/P1 Nuclease [Bacteroidota bacterium]HPE96889.1 zinc dependent phospholipase C family protein [Chitinophagales bacterium]HPR28203.1 zinc dependent phospholipase C family protein [Chitinophagales bacterium]HQU39685.1 zinc dependent phospholipase C family protein [Chitinophagales bacterium]